MLSVFTKTARSKALQANSRVALRYLQASKLSTLQLPPVPTAHATKETEPYFTSTYINGQHYKSDATEWFDVYDPATDIVVAKVPQSTDAELNQAIETAEKAFQSYKNLSIMKRLTLTFNYVELLKKNTDRLAATIVYEQGKSWSAAIADVQRGIQCAEHATTVTKETEGFSLEVSNDMTSHTIREPIGVIGSIMPFNFPVMIPLWTIPYIIATGNTTVIKPSEMCPGTGAILAEIAKEAGVPDGVINIVHGKAPTVNKIVSDPRIKAVTFVGGNNAGKYVYTEATKNGKRAQVNLGAKNHVVVLPDADKQTLLKGVVAGAFSSTGQVCLSTDILFLVGEARKFIPDIVETVKALETKPGFQDGDFGPLVTKQSLERLEAVIQDAVDQGAEVLVDGRGKKPAGFEDGYFIGPTLLRNVKKGMRCVDEELFGPIFTIVEADSLDETIDYCNNNEFGNSVAVFTNSGPAANRFAKAINIGQVGINVPIPIPLAQFGFTSNKASFLGDLHFYGPSAFKFLTQAKTITTSWKGIDYK
ncbi:Retinal dehydrogenase [Wickerhamomyces ciferrii]|uniref:methylmalonate-semialdehyde dehydrogenase (CoA acylating) n=1 Tax=Wickerhamomyces ciferrii (strain ATCC 14091 / BCRC 22168 / CBS 111 / JCM 3599 / NBRC 0793 / NRRL Y-1031 F-60-10) TaxID=1206466 RepID=K0KXW6_WICCF|nr:Retinal dehydrogenase [Wickerhamomyces ciferrii]CCH46279.1 Retinal dehydrogenase [Wickerhamomyces ciferrii]